MAVSVIEAGATNVVAPVERLMTGGSLVGLVIVTFTALEVVLAPSASCATAVSG